MSNNPRNNWNLYKMATSALSGKFDVVRHEDLNLLETRHYINKTIQKLTLENWLIVKEQKGILSQTSILWESFDLTRDIFYDDIPKLSKDEKNLLEGNISISELKRIKKNKSPCSDGNIADCFFLFFWIDIGDLFLNL